MRLADSHAIDQQYRLRGRLLFGFGLLGWVSWGPSFMAVVPLPVELKPLMLPAGFLVGLLVGNCIAAFVRPFVSRATDDNREEVTDEDS